MKNRLSEAKSVQEALGIGNTSLYPKQAWLTLVTYFLHDYVCNTGCQGAVTENPPFYRCQELGQHFNIQDTQMYKKFVNPYHQIKSNRRQANRSAAVG